MRRLAVMVAVFASAALVAGCGGSANGDGATTTQSGGVTTTQATGTETTQAAGPTAIVMMNISFQPGEITVPVGSTVTWTNQDGVAHTTTSREDVWDSGGLVGGDSFPFTFEEPGTYPFFCRIHPQLMQGTVTVEG